ncbi:DUF983 domain-containing protein [Tistrella bauzanensis]|uniref:DUF983 domain-containing protein n=1 Tax=Tistrella arctica TaxID=3133430 RepID=A0ABU9YJB5_9PROT
MSDRPEGPAWPAVSPLAAGLGCRCPRCGEGRLFKGLLAVRASCDRCGLDLQSVASDDGPAAFVILIVGFILMALVLWVELTWAPPMWLHLLLWLPLAVVLSVGLLRPMKAWMIAQQYRHRVAGLGREDDDTED